MTIAASITAIAASSAVSPAFAVVTPSAIPLATVGTVAVVGGHVLVTPGHGGGNAIAVYAPDGTFQQTLTGYPGAADVATSSDGNTVYITESDADAIAVVDAATLGYLGSISTGLGTCPRTIALTAGLLMYGYGCNPGQWTSGIGVASPTPGAVGNMLRGGYNAAPALIANPIASAVLYAGDTYNSPSTIERFTVTGVTPAAGPALTLTATNVFGSCDSLNSLAAAADGATVIAACGYPYAHQIFDGVTLATVGQYTSNPYPNAVAVAKDGTVAVASLTATPAVYVYTPSGTPVTQISVASGVTIVPNGLAWSPDSHVLYALAKRADGSGFDLLTNRIVAASTSYLTLDAAQTYPVGTVVHISGRLQDVAGAAIAGRTVAVVRRDSSGDTTLPTATTGTDGRFLISDNGTTVSKYEYVAAFAGDATYDAATGWAQTAVVRSWTTLTLNVPASATVGTQITVSGLLTSATGAVAGLPVRVTAGNATASGTTVGTATTGSDGTWRLVLPVATAGPYTLQASFDGSSLYAPCWSVPATTQVLKQPSALTFSGPATAVAGGPVQLSGVLTSGSSPISGAELLVTRRNPDGSSVALPSPVTTTTGSFALTDAATLPSGVYTYTAVWAGTATVNAAQAPAVFVTLTKIPSTLTLMPAPTTVRKNSTVTVTATLTGGQSNRTVSIWSQPTGGTRTLLVTGTVSSTGTLSVAYRVTTGVTLSATYDGDGFYAPASASSTLMLR